MSADFIVIYVDQDEKLEKKFDEKEIKEAKRNLSNLIEAWLRSKDKFHRNLFVREGVEKYVLPWKDFGLKYKDVSKHDLSKNLTVGESDYLTHLIEREQEEKEEKGEQFVRPSVRVPPLPAPAPAPTRVAARVERPMLPTDRPPTYQREGRFRLETPRSIPSGPISFRTRTVSGMRTAEPYAIKLFPYPSVTLEEKVLKRFAPTEEIVRAIKEKRAEELKAREDIFRRSSPATFFTARRAAPAPLPVPPAHAPAVVALAAQVPVLPAAAIQEAALTKLKGSAIFESGDQKGISVIEGKYLFPRIAGAGEEKRAILVDLTSREFQQLFENKNYRDRYDETIRTMIEVINRSIVKGISDVQLQLNVNRNLANFLISLIDYANLTELRAAEPNIINLCVSLEKLGEAVKNLPYASDDVKALMNKLIDIDDLDADRSFKRRGCRAASVARPGLGL